MEDGEWCGPITRPYTPRKKKVEKPTPPPEKETIYYGEESFMNAIHPNEVNSKKYIKRSSPLQRAIIDCIEKNGGKATETQILDYITEKWDIINKYSERGVLVEPNIRVVRLNCAVKKKGRHLFTQSPNDPETWMFQIAAKRNEKIQVEQTEKSSPEVSSPVEIPEIIQNDIKKEDDEIPFEKCLYNCFKEGETYLHFDHICEYMKKYENNKGLFHRLPFERRIKACLISLQINHQICTVYQRNQLYYSLCY